MHINLHFGLSTNQNINIYICLILDLEYSYSDAFLINIYKTAIENVAVFYVKQFNIVY